MLGLLLVSAEGWSVPLVDRVLLRSLSDFSISLVITLLFSTPYLSLVFLESYGLCYFIPMRGGLFSETNELLLISLLSS